MLLDFDVTNGARLTLDVYLFTFGSMATQYSNNTMDLG